MKHTLKKSLPSPYRKSLLKYERQVQHSMKQYARKLKVK